MRNRNNNREIASHHYERISLNYEWWQIKKISIIEKKNISEQYHCMFIGFELEAHPTIKYQTIVKNQKKSIEMKIDLENINKSIKYQTLEPFVKQKFVSFMFDISKKKKRGAGAAFEKIEKILTYYEDSVELIIPEAEFNTVMQHATIYTIVLPERAMIHERWITNNSPWTIDPKTIFAKTVQHLKHTSQLKKTCFVCGKNGLDYYNNTHYVCNIDKHNIVDRLIFKIWNHEYVIKKKKISSKKLEAVFENSKDFFWPFVKYVHIAMSQYYLQRYIVNGQHKFEFEAHPYPIPIQFLKTTIIEKKKESAKKAQIECATIADEDCFRCLYKLYHLKINNNYNVYFNFNYNSQKIQKIEGFIKNLTV